MDPEVNPMRYALSSLTAALLAPATAIAHPGHGAEGLGHTLLHYLTEPTHAGVAVLGAAGVALAIRAARRHKRTPR
jgi:hypothetical protein